MRKRLPWIAAAFTLLGSASAFAGVVPPTPVPEPGTWALVGLAAVIGAVVSRNRRK